MEMQDHKAKLTIVTYSVVVLSFACVALTSALIWTICGSPRDDNDSTTVREAAGLTESDRQYLDSLPRPPVGSQGLVSLLRKDKMIKTQETYDWVCWHVYRGNVDVIRQLIANLPYEKEVVLPEENGGTLVSLSFKTDFHGPLLPAWIGPHTLGPILHRELLRHTANKETDPHLIFLLIEEIEICDEIMREGWYTLQMQADDMLACLRIYAHYPQWPTLLSSAERMILSMGPYDRWDYDTMQEVLETAQQEGAEPAYSMYLERFHTNSHKSEGELGDLRHPGTSLRVENTFRGWCSEDVSGQLIVYDVNVPDAIIGMPHVDKIVSVLRNDEDITDRCVITDYRLMEDLMVIPLRQASVVKIDYKIHVTHKWWPGPPLWDYVSGDPKAKPLRLGSIGDDEVSR